MANIDQLYSAGLLISGVSFGFMLGHFMRHFTDLRIVIPRLFDEYRQEELS